MQAGTFADPRRLRRVGRSSGQPADPQPRTRPRPAPFTSTAVATFNSPWAMAFLPGSRTLRIVTEKPGRIWLVDITNGSKQPVGGAPACRHSRRKAACSTSKLSPTFASDSQVYLTYAEPSANGGSGLALARAQLVRDTSGAQLQNLTGAVARSGRRRRRPVRRDHRLRAGRQVAVPELGRAAALHARAGPEPAARQDPAPDARRQAGAGQSGGGRRPVRRP